MCLFGKELFSLFAASAFRKLSSIYVFSYFPFGFEGRIWDLIVSVPDHCLSFYLRQLCGWTLWTDGVLRQLCGCTLWTDGVLRQLCGWTLWTDGVLRQLCE